MGKTSVKKALKKSKTKAVEGRGIDIEDDTKEENNVNLKEISKDVVNKDKGDESGNLTKVENPGIREKTNDNGKSDSTEKTEDTTKSGNALDTPLTEDKPIFQKDETVKAQAEEVLSKTEEDQVGEMEQDIADALDERAKGGTTLEQPEPTVIAPKVSITPRIVKFNPTYTTSTFFERTMIDNYSGISDLLSPSQTGANRLKAIEELIARTSLLTFNGYCVPEVISVKRGAAADVSMHMASETISKMSLIDGILDHRINPADMSVFESRLNPFEHKKRTWMPGIVPRFSDVKGTAIDNFSDDRSSATAEYTPIIANLFRVQTMGYLERLYQSHFKGRQFILDLSRHLYGTHVVVKDTHDIEDDGSGTRVMYGLYVFPECKKDISIPLQKFYDAMFREYPSLRSEMVAKSLNAARPYHGDIIAGKRLNLFQDKRAPINAESEITRAGDPSYGVNFSKSLVEYYGGGRDCKLVLDENAITSLQEDVTAPLQVVCLLQFTDLDMWGVDSAIMMVTYLCSPFVNTSGATPMMLYDMVTQGIAADDVYTGSHEMSKLFQNHLIMPQDMILDWKRRAQTKSFTKSRFCDDVAVFIITICKPRMGRHRVKSPVYSWSDGFNTNTSPDVACAQTLIANQNAFSSDPYVPMFETEGAGADGQKSFLFMETAALGMSSRYSGSASISGTDAVNVRVQKQIEEFSSFLSLVSPSFVSLRPMVYALSNRTSVATACALIALRTVEASANPNTKPFIKRPPVTNISQWTERDFIDIVVPLSGAMSLVFNSLTSTSIVPGTHNRINRTYRDIGVELDIIPDMELLLMERVLYNVYMAKLFHVADRYWDEVRLMITSCITGILPSLDQAKVSEHITAYYEHTAYDSRGPMAEFSCNKDGVIGRYGTMDIMTITEEMLVPDMIRNKITQCNFLREGTSTVAEGLLVNKLGCGAVSPTSTHFSFNKDTGDMQHYGNFRAVDGTTYSLRYKAYTQSIRQIEILSTDGVFLTDDLVDEGALSNERTLILSKNMNDETMKTLISMLRRRGSDLINVPLTEDVLLELLDEVNAQQLQNKVLNREGSKRSGQASYNLLRDKSVEAVTGISYKRYTSIFIPFVKMKTTITESTGDNKYLKAAPAKITISVKSLGEMLKAEISGEISIPVFSGIDMNWEGQKASIIMNTKSLIGEEYSHYDRSFNSYSIGDDFPKNSVASHVPVPFHGYIAVGAEAENSGIISLGQHIITGTKLDYSDVIESRGLFNATQSDTVPFSFMIRNILDESYIGMPPINVKYMKRDPLTLNRSLIDLNPLPTYDEYPLLGLKPYVEVDESLEYLAVDMLSKSPFITLLLKSSKLTIKPLEIVRPLLPESADLTAGPIHIL
jgi:hypothetical protein